MSNTLDLDSDPEGIPEKSSSNKSNEELEALCHKYLNIHGNSKPPFSVEPYEKDCPTKRYTVYDMIKDFKMTHLYRTVSEIVKLKDVKFYFTNLRIMGYFIQINGIGYIKALYSNKKIELDCEVFDVDYPPLNSIRLILGTVQYKQIKVENKLTQIPYIIVKCFYFVPVDMADYYHDAMKGVRDILSKVIFETVPLDNDNELSDSNSDENISFNAIETTFCLNKLESDEMLFYEAERLMNIDLSLFE